MNALLTATGGLQPIVDAPVWVVLLLKITAILLFAWFAHLALRRANPRWRVFLWRVTGFGLVALPAVAWLFPALQIHVQPPPLVKKAVATSSTTFETAKTDRVAAARGQTGLSGNPSDARAEHILPLSPSEQSETAVSSAMLQPQTLAPPSPKPPLVTWPTLLLAAWLGGIVVLVIRLSIGQYRIWQMVRSATHPPLWICGGCTRVAEKIGCRSGVEVLQSADISSPFLCGLSRPRMLLPARMCDDSYLKDLPGIFAHELTHVRSHDVFWNVGLQLISLVLWFHPLVWRVRKAHLAACELVCDAASATFVGDVSDYCRTLARVAVDACRSLPAAGIAMARTSAISRRLNALKERVLHLPLRRRSVIGFGFAALVAVAVIGAMQFALAAPPPAEAGTAANKEKAKPAEQEPKPANNADVAPKISLMRVRVLDPQGKPLPDANIHASIWTEEKGFKANHDYKTDTVGIVRVELPKTYYIVRLWSGKKPFVTLFSHWEQNELNSGTKLPEEYTIQLERAVSAGGRIVDEQGKPIAGARVEVSVRGGKPAKSDGRTGYSMWLALKSADPKVGETPAPTTDADGRWRIDDVPKDAKCELTLQVSHPDYVSDDSWGQLQKDADITTAMLRSETAVLTMKRGIIVRGRVTDPDGKPIKDALIVRGNDPYFSSVPSEFPTDKDGYFRLPAMPSGEQILTVVAPGWAPQLRRVNVSNSTGPQDFRMEPGKPIRLQFVDTAGKPIPEVYVNIQQWRGGKSLYNVKHPKVLDTKIPEKADKNGVWEWTWAPDDPVKVHVYSYPLKGYAPCELEIAGGAPPRTVTLKAEHRITGRVTDAVTGKPIPAFTIIPINVFRKNWLSAERMNAKAGKDGRLDYLAKRTDMPLLRLRIEATGYRTQTGAEFRVGDDTSRTQDFRLKPSKPVTGVVLDAAGLPAKNVEVLVATPTEQVRLQSDFGNRRLSTDTSGRFEFPDPGEPFTIVATADTGFALADFTADQRDAGILRLQPWASVRGQFFDGGQLVQGATLFLKLVRLGSLDRPRVDTNRLQVVTDKDGRFEFPRVPPGLVTVRVLLGTFRDWGYRSGPSVPLNLQPGQKVEMKLGQSGATVNGKVKLTGRVPADLDCTYSLNHLIRLSPGIEPPPSIANLGFNIRKGWQSTWRKTREGQAYLSTLQHWFVKLAPNGTFRISGVPPGEYDLAIEVYAKPSGCLVDPLARKVVRVTVTAEDAARGKLTLPEIAAAVVPVPAVGDTPSLSFQLATGGSGSLADFRGRYTAVHFWASWCGPCKQHLPALRHLRERMAARGGAMLGLSLDDDAAVWQAALKRIDVSWQQGRLTAVGETAISSVPAYWLLDPSGKIVAKANDPDELAAAMDGKPAEKAAKPVSGDNSIPTTGSLRVSAVDKAGKPIPGAGVKIEKAGKEGPLTMVAESVVLKGRENGPLTVASESVVLKDPQAASNSAIKPGFRPMQIHVLDSDGKPVADAGITVRGMTNLPFGPNRYRTDIEGSATIEAPKGDVKDLQVLVWKDKYVTAGAVWKGNGVRAQVPEEFSFTLEQGTIFGGMVRDKQGKPIAAAEVTVDGRKPRLPDSPRWISIYDTVKTNAEGKWQVHRIPKDLAGFELEVKVKRPDVAAIERFGMKALPIDKLRDQTAVFVLRKGTVLEGMVTDPQRKPAVGATVGLFPELSGSDFPRTKVDQNGYYRLTVTEPGEYTLAAAAKGYAPDSRRLTVKDQSQTVDLQLRKGEMIRLQVVDKAGKPMPGATVSTVFNNEYRDALMLDYQSAFERDNDRHMSADADGRWSRLWIPNDTLTLLISKLGCGQVQIKIKPGEPERTVTLEAGGWSIAGRVLDAETKTPLTEFRVVEGDNYSGHAMWRKTSVVKNTNGEYHAHWDTSGNAHRVVRIEANGYLPSESRQIEPNERSVTFNVALRKGKEIAGRVLGPDGKPVADAEVCLCSATRLLTLRNSYPALDQTPLIVRTAADGRFAQAPQGEPYILVVLHDKGYARFDGDGGPGDIMLKPWGRIEGTLRIADRPAAKQHVRLVFDDEVISNPRLLMPGTVRVDRYLYHRYKTQTNDVGHFSFERVRPGKAKLCQHIKLSQEGMMSSWTDGATKAVEIIPGQTLTVELNGADSSAIRQRRLNEKRLRDRKIASRKQEDTEHKNRIEAALKVLHATPPAAQDARIEAALEILRNYSIGKNEKTWATAIRELIAIGKAAVPKLIAELDRTERPQTLSALGFALRGIGDPRAVPALIRAIPRLYPGGGSDCGLRINGDPDLTKFMLEHDNHPREYPRHDQATFSFGRPIREIMPALQKITGQSHGWMDLNFADRQGQGAEQDRIKHIAFLKHAERWADWWSKNWPKYVSTEADAQLDLTRKALDQYAESITKMPHRNPPVEIPRGPNVVVGSGASNYFIKSFDESQPGGISQAFLDFDSGRHPNPPQELIKASSNGEPSKELLAWAEQEGVDLITVKTKLPGIEEPVYAFKPLGMKVWRIDNARFDNLQNELCYGEKGKLGEPWSGLIAQTDEKTGKFDDTLTATYLFITKEGICGAIQIQSPLSREPVPGMPVPRTGGWHYKYIYERTPGAEE